MLIFNRTDPKPHPRFINLSQIVPVCIKCIPSLLKNSKQEQFKLRITAKVIQDFSYLKRNMQWKHFTLLILILNNIEGNYTLFIIHTGLRKTCLSKETFSFSSNTSS